VGDTDSNRKDRFALASRYALGFHQEKGASMHSRKKDPNRAIWAAGLMLAVACAREGSDTTVATPGPPLAGGSPVVARVNGEPLTIADLQAATVRGVRGDSRHALDTAVARRLAAQEARRRGLDASDEMRAQVEALRREAAVKEEELLRDALQASLATQIAVTEEEARARYQQRPPRETGQRLRLRRAAFPSEEAARAEDQRLGADGRLDPATSEEIGPASVEQLRQSGLTGMMRLHEPGRRIVVEREGNFALLELVEVLPPEPAPFEEVRERIEAQIRAQKAAEALAKLMQELRAAARLEIDEAVLQNEAAWPQSAGEAAPLRRPWR
jgi:hypothetical protein